MNIIFAVTEDQFPIYNHLTGNSNHTLSLIEGSAAGILKSDSSNVVQLIEDEYKKITSAIELKDNATNYVKISYASACLGDKLEETNICKGLRVGDSVSFELTITVEQCPEDRSEWNKTIKVYPVGLNDELLIDISMLCDCECEQEWNVVEKSPVCTGNGAYQCGICVCNNRFYGSHCECNPNDSNQAVDEQNCIRGNDTKACSGRGTCQ